MPRSNKLKVHRADLQTISSYPVRFSIDWQTISSHPVRFSIDILFSSLASFVMSFCYLGFCFLEVTNKYSDTFSNMLAVER